MSTPADNTRQKTTITSTDTLAITKQLKDKEKAEFQGKEMVLTPKGADKQITKVLAVAKSQSVGKTKSSPRVFRMLDEEKKEELIQKWLMSSKTIEGSSNLSDSQQSVNCASHPDLVNKHRTDANLKEDQGKQDISGQSSEITLNIKGSRVQSLTSLTDTAIITRQEDTESVMSCQVTTGRMSKGEQMRKQLGRLYQKQTGKKILPTTEAIDQTMRKEVQQQKTDDEEVSQQSDTPSHADVDPNGNTGQIDQQTEQSDQNEDILEQFKKRLDDDDKTVVYDMFELLITKMTTVQESIKEVKGQQIQVSQKVATIEKSLDFYAQSIEEIDVDMDDVANMNVKIVQAVIKGEEEIEKVKSQTKRVLKIQNKGSFLVHGIETNAEESYKTQVTNFLKHKMMITKSIEISSAHTIGKRKNSPIWFKLADPDDIAVIFEHVSNLKDKKNTYDRSYRIQPFEEEEEREQKARNQDLIADNRRLPTSHQSTMKYLKGTLHIDGAPYQKEVKPPTVKDILLMDKKKERSIEEAGIHIGDMKSVNESTFYAYLAEVDDMKKVKEAYEVIKNEHISSTHIVVGYRLLHRKFYNFQDYSDDGESYAGRTVLNVLKAQNVWNTAIFIVRYHEGPNLGKLRFQIYEDLAKDALASVKKCLNYGQKLPDQGTLKVFNKAEHAKQKFLRNRSLNNRGARGGNSGRGSMHGHGKRRDNPPIGSRQQSYSDVNESGEDRGSQEWLSTESMDSNLPAQQDQQK